MFTRHSAPTPEDDRAARERFIRELIDVASGTDAPGGEGSLLLRANERRVGELRSVSLIGMTKTPGHWSGSSRGVSVPVGSLGGHAVRFRVGQTHGHYVQGEPHPSAIDSGTLTVTTQRITYQGASHTVEHDLAKLLSVEHHGGEFVLSVSNRQHPTTLFVGTAVEVWLDARIHLALALHAGQGDAAITQLRAQLAEVTSSEPPH